MVYKYSYTFGAGYPGTLKVHKIEVERETAKTAWVKRSSGTGWNARMPIEKLFPTAGEALKAAEPEAERRIEDLKKSVKRLEENLRDLREAVGREG